MIKTKIVETIEKFDKDGNLIEKITKETNTEDDEIRAIPYLPSRPQTMPLGNPYEPCRNPLENIPITCENNSLVKTEIV